LIEENNWTAKVNTLFAATEANQWSPQLTEQYNVLDSKLTQAKLSAEKQCRKLCTGHTPWIPALMQAIQQIQYWKGIAKRARGSKINMTVLKQQSAKGQLIFSSTHWMLPVATLNQKI